MDVFHIVFVQNEAGYEVCACLLTEMLINVIWWRNIVLHNRSSVK